MNLAAYFAFVFSHLYGLPACAFSLAQASAVRYPPSREICAQVVEARHVSSNDLVVANAVRSYRARIGVSCLPDDWRCERSCVSCGTSCRDRYTSKKSSQNVSANVSVEVKPKWRDFLVSPSSKLQ